MHVFDFFLLFLLSINYLTADSRQQIRVNTRCLSPLLFQNMLEAVGCALKC